MVEPRRVLRRHLASTLSASLQLSKEGEVRLLQQGDFTPIQVVAMSAAAVPGSV